VRRRRNTEKQKQRRTEHKEKNAEKKKKCQPPSKPFSGLSFFAVGSSAANNNCHRPPRH
jgi:hypothetical protein